MPRIIHLSSRRMGKTAMIERILESHPDATISRPNS